MFNIANNITLARIFSVPLIVLLLYFPGKVNNLVAMLVFIAASLTDLVDGLIARRYNLVTTIGKFLDALVDKIFVLGVLIVLLEPAAPGGPTRGAGGFPRWRMYRRPRQRRARRKTFTRWARYRPSATSRRTCMPG